MRLLSLNEAVAAMVIQEWRLAATEDANEDGTKDGTEAAEGNSGKREEDVAGE